MKHLFQKGAIHQTGDGEGMLLWKDAWVDNCPLKISYANLFNICSNPDISVADCLVDDEWRIDLIDSLVRLRQTPGCY